MSAAIERLNRTLSEKIYSWMIEEAPDLLESIEGMVDEGYSPEYIGAHINQIMYSPKLASYCKLAAMYAAVDKDRE